MNQRSAGQHRFALGALLFLGSAATGLTPIADGDVFWHLAAGREMLRRQSFLRSDMFSTGAFGRTWTDVHWLFQLGVYAVERRFGLLGLVLAKCLLVGLAALLLYAATPRRARPWLLVILLAALACARQLLLVRPVLVSLLGLGLFYGQLEAFRRTGSSRRLWLLPLVQVGWSNCQGLSAFGPALLFAYALAALTWASVGASRFYPFAPESYVPRTQRARRAWTLMAVLIACLFASLITPYGAAGFKLPIELLRRLLPLADNPYRNVAENMPPFVLERISGEFWHLKWFLGGLCLALAANGGRIALSQLLLLVGFVGLALMSNRNVLLLYFMAAPLAAQQLSAAWRRARKLRRRAFALPASRWGYGVVLLGLFGLIGSAAAREPSLRAVTPFRFPVQSAGIIAAHGGEGSIFSADHQGGYLIWKLYPAFRPFIDTRLILRTPDEYDDYLALADDPLRFDAFQARHHFDYVVLPVAYPDRYLSLIAYLYESPAWALVHTDGSEVLFARRDLTGSTRLDLGSPDTIDHILSGLTERYAGRARLLAAARLQLATLELAVREFTEAERVLRPSSDAPALALLAKARLLAGDIDAAEKIGTRLLTQQRRDVRGLDLLAQVSVRRGELSRALGYLRRALAIDPYDGEAASLLSALEEPRHGP
jgi:hypothetical protein